MKKKIIMALVILGFATGCGKVPVMKDGDQAVVTFEKEDLNISTTNLYEKIKVNYALSNLIDMVDTKIFSEKYADKTSEAEKSAESQFEQIKTYYVDDNGKYDESSLLNALNSYYGISSIKDFKEMLKLSYYRDLAVDDYAKESITDKEIEKYYEEKTVGDISCSHILISPKTTDSMTDDEKKKAEEEALNKAKEVIKKLNDGADFAELAKEYSDDSSNASKGGDLGYFNTGDMVEEFETAAQKLKLNEYTKDPVKTKFGYHIILKTGEKEKPSLDDSKESIIEKLASEKIDSDKTLSINALVELRKSYGMTIEDSELKSQYEKYISNQLLNANTTTSNN